MNKIKYLNLNDFFLHELLKIYIKLFGNVTIKIILKNYIYYALSNLINPDSLKSKAFISP